MSEKNACYGCPKRWVKTIDGKTTTCHSGCEKYEKMVAENNERRAMLNKSRAAYNKEKRDYIEKVARLKKHNWSKKK